MKDGIAKKAALTGLFAAAAIILSYVDSLIPIPIPGVKLGLGNVAVLMTLYTLGKKYALGICAVRVLTMALILGMTMLPYSLAGALFSFLGMILAKRIRNISITAVSMIGAVLHNIGQILIAVIVLSTPALIVYYLPLLLIAALITGFLTGSAARLTVRYININEY